MDLNNQDDIPTCRICHCTESPSSGLVKLISPCHCSGSLKYVHHSCLQQWLDATNSQRCELCKYPFSMSVKYKPLYKWGSLNASPSERRRLICNSVFNLVSMVCIFWSIYVLIERASFDAHSGRIDFTFYVKISVVTLGLIIGVIFLFVQLKLYFSIFMKWRQSNRIIVIRNANFSNHNHGNSNTSSNTGNTITTSNNSNTNSSSATGKVEARNDRSNSITVESNGEHIIQMNTTQGERHTKEANEDEFKKTATEQEEFFTVPLVGVIEGQTVTGMLQQGSLGPPAFTAQDGSQDFAGKMA